MTARDCLTGDCSPLALLGFLPLIPGSVGKYGDEAVDLLPASVRSFAGETADTIRGRAAHANYPLALGSEYRYEELLPSGLRPDAINWQDHIVRELKPDNARAIQKGWSQIKKYISELFEMTGDTWTGFVDTYKK